MPLADWDPSTASCYLRPPIPIGAVVVPLIIAADSYTPYFESPTISSASTIHPSNIIYQQNQSVEMKKIFDYTIRLTLPKTNNTLMGRH